jgi:hypothetical protein
MNNKELTELREESTQINYKPVPIHLDSDFGYTNSFYNGDNYLSIERYYLDMDKVIPLFIYTTSNITAINRKYWVLDSMTSCVYIYTPLFISEQFINFDDDSFYKWANPKSTRIIY